MPEKSGGDLFSDALDIGESIEQSPVNILPYRIETLVIKHVACNIRLQLNIDYFFRNGNLLIYRRNTVFAGVCHKLREQILVSKPFFE